MSHLFNDRVVSQSDSLLSRADLSKPTLVDQLLDALQIWVAIGNVWLDLTEHVHRGLVDFDKDAIVDLSKTEKLQNLPCLGVHIVDTADTDLYRAFT